MRGGTWRPLTQSRRSPYFNPPAPCGAGRGGGGEVTAGLLFQSTRPMRGGTLANARPRFFVKFQSTRPMRGGTRWHQRRHRRSRDFNPPAPCGAGPSSWAMNSASKYFNPPAPCGAGQRRRNLSRKSHGNFNPPAPCGAGLGSAKVRNHIYLFQSTRPMRGGTWRLQTGGDGRGISIHPPHAGRDRKAGAMWRRWNISIHPPHAGRDFYCEEG